MTGMPEHAHRAANHRQPRVPDSHWSASGDLHAGTDPAACLDCATPLDRATPHAHDWADLAERDGVHRTYRASYCRLCGETQID